MEYYRQSSADTLHALDSTPDGLTQAQADERLARDGHNAVSYTHLTLPTILLV